MWRLCSRVLVALTLAMAPALVPATDACEIVCIPPTARGMLAENPYVFAGRVVAGRVDDGRGEYDVEPVRVWKGRLPNRSRFRIETVGSASCGYPIVVGALYVFIASTEPQRIGICDHQPVPVSSVTLPLVHDLDRRRGHAPLRPPVPPVQGDHGAPRAPEHRP